jgi:SAM-dependent methyltransferase
MQTTDATYLLDNAGREAPARFDALSRMFDRTTERHLSDRGVGAGWHCLEVGAGGGSIAVWLADRVGPGGRVLATDLDPRHLEALATPHLEVRRHNIATEPLPADAFDLIHGRLVLNSIPDWHAVLTKLVAALKPGGWLVAEEFDSESLPPDPAESAGEVLLTTHRAMGRLMCDRNFDRRFGRLLFGRLKAQGLANIQAEARVVMVTGGSAGASLLRANVEQLRGAMIGAGYVTGQEFDRDLARLAEPDFMMPSSMMWTAWGQKVTA